MVVIVCRVDAHQVCTAWKQGRGHGTARAIGSDEYQVVQNDECPQCLELLKRSEGGLNVTETQDQVGK